MRNLLILVVFCSNTVFAQITDLTYHFIENQGQINPAMPKMDSTKFFSIEMVNESFMQELKKIEIDVSLGNKTSWLPIFYSNYYSTETWVDHNYLQCHYGITVGGYLGKRITNKLLFGLSGSIENCRGKLYEGSFINILTLDRDFHNIYGMLRPGVTINHQNLCVGLVASLYSSLYNKGGLSDISSNNFYLTYSILDAYKRNNLRVGLTGVLDLKKLLTGMDFGNNPLSFFSNAITVNYNKHFASFEFGRNIQHNFLTVSYKNSFIAKSVSLCFAIRYFFGDDQNISYLHPNMFNSNSQYENGAIFFKKGI